MSSRSSSHTILHDSALRNLRINGRAISHYTPSYFIHIYLFDVIVLLSFHTRIFLPNLESRARFSI